MIIVPDILQKILRVGVVSVFCLAAPLATAGGITLGGTRIVYAAGTKAMGLTVRNTSEKSNFMVQSWVETPDGRKSRDFVVTPPLYVSGPGNENSLRLMYVGPPARASEETLYYFNSKAIPAVDREANAGKNTLMLAVVTRIKLFVRPDGLEPSVDKAPALLTFHRSEGQIKISNPTPYYITLAQMTAGGHKLPDTMVAPRASAFLPFGGSTGSRVTFRTINDFGAVTPEQGAVVK